jgi:hypothetical protein
MAGETEAFFDLELLDIPGRRGRLDAFGRGGVQVDRETARRGHR